MTENAGVRLSLVGNTPMGSGNIQLYSVGFSATKDDPLAQRASVGYKYVFGGGIVEQGGAGILYHAVPTLGVGQANTLIDLKNLPVATPSPQLMHAAVGSSADSVSKFVKEQVEYAVLNCAPALSADSLDLGDVVNTATGVALTDTDLNPTDLTAPIDPLYLSVKVTGKQSATGEKNVLITFNLDAGGFDLDTVIVQPNLGEIAMVGATPTAAEIFAAMISNNPQAPVKFSTYAFSNITATSADVQNSAYSGTVKLAFKKQGGQSFKPQLNTVLKESALGSISMSGSAPTSAELQTAILAKSENSGCSAISASAWHFSDISATSATASADNYTGTVSLTFSKLLPALSTVVQTVDLKAFAMAGATPTDQELLDAITAISANSGASTTLSDWTFPSPTATACNGVECKGYSGTVDLTYSKMPALTSVITTTDLGTFT